MIKALKKTNSKVATVESCTGGMLSAAITSISGASKVFEYGICTYSDQAKMKMVGVKEETLKKYTAVSSETATEMVSGILALTGSDYAVSTTGYAGSSLDPNIPSGTIYIGIAGKGFSTYTLSLFRPDLNREELRKYITFRALHALLMEIIKSNPEIINL